jgi:hypothetical protein
LDEAQFWQTPDDSEQISFARYVGEEAKQAVRVHSARERHKKHRGERGIFPNRPQENIIHPSQQRAV